MWQTAQMTEITFGYSDSEDRVWLSSSDGTRFWLTRRLLSGLLGPITELLEKTVPGGDIPNALAPAQRVVLEHEEALADTPEGQPVIEANKETRVAGAPAGRPPALVTSVTVQGDSNRCALILTAGSAPSRIDLNRMDFHRLLTALYQTTVNARWGLGGLPGWLTGMETSLE